MSLPATPSVAVLSSAERPESGAVSRRRRVANRYRGLWLFLIPAALIYVFVVVWPSIQGAGLAFTDWDGISPNRNFVGLDNFAHVLTDPKGLAAVVRTVVIAVVITIVQNVIGLLLALGANSRIKSRNLLRVLLFAPAVITPVATAYLWQNILSPQGPLNSALDQLGLGALKQDWLGNANIAIWCICFVVIWQFSGYSMVIYLANLQSVPQEVIEATYVDGAGPWRRFWSVVRPELAPAITINLMLSIIGGLKLFDQVWILTNGGPGGGTETMSTLLYKSAFNYGEYGYGIALAVVLTLLVAVLSSGQYALLSRQNKR